MTVKRLNVVFHGTFLFWVKPEEIEVLAPYDKMHAYYAGNWERGTLQWLEPGTYTLRVDDEQPVRKPPAAFDKDATLWFPGPPIDTYPSLRRIRVPRPLEIRTLQRLTLEKSNFYGSEDGINIPKKVLGLVHVLTYALNGSHLSLEGVKWTPKPNTQGAINLHFFADPPTRMSKPAVTLKHPSTAFNALMRLLPAEQAGNALRLHFRYLPNEIPLVDPSGDLPPGLPRIQLVNLAISNLLREDDLKPLGRMGDNSFQGKVEMRKDDIGCSPGHTCVGGGTGGGGNGGG